MNPLELIKKQIKNNCFPHAYLFSGNDLTAKEEAIDLIKKNYLDLQSPDFFEINPEDGKISIDAIRILKEKAFLTSLAGSKNIFLIRSIEYLNREAEVALLKTLEDLPESSILLATCENYNSLLPAVKSRFSHLRFFSAEGGKKHESNEETENLEILVRNSLLRYSNELPKNFSQLFIFKIEKLLALQNILPNLALNRRMAKDYLDMIERIV